MRALHLIFTLFTFQALPGLLADANTIKEPSLNALDGFIGDTRSALGAKQTFARLFKSLQAIQAKAPPNSAKDVASRLAKAHARSKATGYVDMTAELIREGITDADIESMGLGLNPLNNEINKNTREPSTPIFPKRSRKDAPYSQTEEEMRQQIFIPSTFTYGNKPPVILIPGTGERGGNSFQSNYMKLLQDKEYADIVWINPPKYQLDDAQTNSETVAYAINYISGISKNRNVSVVSWSQGTINVQWALKYWPSVRKTTSVHVGNSGDYHGTVVANLISPLHLVAFPPAIFQQSYTSNFIKVLRSNGGDSAYIPTTNIYSGFFDEVVEPQQGTGASAFLKDSHRAGVTNVDIGQVCGKTALAGFATHESVLYNSLTHALANDALKHKGPARLDRIDVKAICNASVASGLTLEDVLVTEKTIPFAVFQIAVYLPKVFKEPEIRPYAI